jgi:SAM-dependent methyltransferase
VTGEARSFDRVAHCYDETRAMPEAAHVAITAGIARALRVVAPVPAVLEIGIGTGRIAVPLVEAGVRIVGIDLARAMVARLHARRPETPVAIADATRLPFGPGTFDGALFVHVLHLLPDPAAALRAARDVVHPGGRLLYAGDRFGSSPVARVAELVREIVGELSGVELERLAPHERAGEAFVAQARAMGVEAVESVLATWQRDVTGRRVLEQIAGRVWSSTWDIPETIMPELLRRLAPRVEALLGDLDRPVPFETTFSLMTADVAS